MAEAPRPLPRGDIAFTLGYDHNVWPDDAHGKPVRENLWSGSGVYGLGRNIDVRILVMALHSLNYDTLINSPAVGSLTRLKWSPAWTRGHAALIGGFGLGFIPRFAVTAEAGLSLGYQYSRLTPFMDLRVGTNNELGSLGERGGSDFDSRYTQANAGVRIVLSPHRARSATFNFHGGGTQAYARDGSSFFAYHGGGYLEMPLVIPSRDHSGDQHPGPRNGSIRRRD